MAYVAANRVFETSTTTGTGDFNLLGAATGFQSFVAGVGDTNTCNYEINDGTDWETGIATITAGSPDVLARTTVTASSNAGAKVNWGSGVKNVFSPFIAGNTVLEPKDNTFTGANDFTGGSITLPDANVTNAKLANVATATIKGRTTAGTGAPEDLTAAQGRTVLDVYSTTETDAAVAAAEPYNSLGAQDTTSGTSKDFVFDNATIKRFTVALNKVSLNATDEVLIQLETSGGVITSGYSSSSSIVLNSGATQVANSSSGNVVIIRAAAENIIVNVDFLLVKTEDLGGGSFEYTWQQSHSGYWSTLRTLQGGGSVVTTDLITGLRVTSALGTSTFDSGFVNVIES